jgi:hypothetical protein
MQDLIFPHNIHDDNYILVGNVVNSRQCLVHRRVRWPVFCMMKSVTTMVVVNTECSWCHMRLPDALRNTFLVYLACTRNSRQRKIWGFHCGNYRQCRLQGCDVERFLYELTYTLLRNDDSYKSHPVSHNWRRHSSWDRVLWKSQQFLKVTAIFSPCQEMSHRSYQYHHREHFPCV